MKWKVVPLEQFAACENSAIKIGPFGSQLKKCDLVPYGIHVVGIENVVEEKFDGFGERYITAEKFQSLKSVEVRPGDLLITMMGTVGEVAIVPPGTSTSVMDSHLLRFRPNLEVCSPRFVAWLIKGSPVVCAAIQERAHGAIMKGLNSSLIRTLPAPLPPLAEQERIVKLLDEADELRKLRDQADRRTANLIPALFHDMIGDPASNRKNWPVVRFAEIGEARLGKMLDAKQQTGRHKRFYLRNANVQWDRLELDDLLEMDFSEADRKEFRLCLGDLLICEGGEVGRAAIWRDELPECYFQKALHRVRLHSSKAVPEYVLYLLRAIAAADGFRDYVGSATIPHLTGVKLALIRILLPPLPLQKEFAARVAEIRAMEVQQSLSRQRLDALFHSFLHRAFRGEL